MKYKSCRLLRRPWKKSKTPEKEDVQKGDGCLDGCLELGID
jgi:hypothetical protein